MIIYGHRQRERDVATGEFHCPRCLTRRGFKHKSIDRYFTLFFITLFRLGHLGDYVECQTCFTTYGLDVLNLSGVGVDGAPAPAAVIRPILPNYTRRGWVLAVIGSGAGVCGIVLGLLVILAQITDEAGPTSNLQGFFGVLILCPLPLAILGILLLAWGLFTVWKNRQEAKADA